MKNQNDNSRNWWLLLGISIICFAGSLGVATEMGLLKLKSPQEMIRRFKPARKGKKNREIEFLGI